MTAFDRGVSEMVAAYYVHFPKRTGDKIEPLIREAARRGWHQGLRAGALAVVVGAAAVKLAMEWWPALRTFLLGVREFITLYLVN